MEDILIPIVALTVPFVFVILIVWFKVNENQKRNQLQAELYAKALEKGQPVPADLFAQPKKKTNPLNTGIICIAVGIGAALFFWFAADAEDKLRGAALGIIPFLVGIAYLIIYFIEKKKTANENAQ